MGISNIRANALRPGGYLSVRLANAASASEYNLGVDGTTPVNFRYTVPTGYAAEIYECKIGLVDGSVDPTNFGAIIGSLTNGLLVKVFDSGDTEKLDFLDGDAIKTNGDFAKLAGVEVSYVSGAGEGHLYASWRFPNDAGSPLVLYPGEYFNVRVADNISALTDFWWVVCGRLHKLT